ncbi:hypothetical protein QAD02_003024 [Eretmocerus hayati]|uniref:Uncharacterized protein n=1 Tax=Eretmocerus hayati TaxID=131215 RepID=A0ACC2NKR5_9HYME|nr:hypothetical protein QAD02_003024 [Eretmocerus hayati]
MARSEFSRIDVLLSVETLKKTDRLKYPIKKCFLGEYMHYGLQKCLEREIIKHGTKEAKNLLFGIHGDGVYLGETRYLWPILAKFAKLNYMLTCGIRVLPDSRRYLSHNTQAKQLLRAFVRDFTDIFGADRPTYNGHGLGYLAFEAKAHGALDSLSACMYENFMRVLKSFIQKPEKPLQQIFRNLRHQSRFVKPQAQKYYPIYEVCGNQSKCLPYEGFTDQFGKVIDSDFELTTKPPDNVCVLEDDTIVVTEYFAFQSLVPVMIGRQFTTREDIPYYSAPSTGFDICIASGLSTGTRY